MEVSCRSGVVCDVCDVCGELDPLPHAASKPNVTSSITAAVEFNPSRHKRAQPIIP